MPAMRAMGGAQMCKTSKYTILIGSQKVLSQLFVTQYLFGESEKCHFRFPYKSMTYIAGH